MTNSDGGSISKSFTAADGTINAGAINIEESQAPPREIHLLRPHHGMCLAFFAGRGYSDAFCANMAEMKTVLEGGSHVKLTCGADCICAACPNLCKAQGNSSLLQCISHAKVCRYDRAVLEALSLPEGAVISYNEFSQLVKSKILDTGRRGSICADCGWTGLCDGS